MLLPQHSANSGKARRPSGQASAELLIILGISLMIILLFSAFSADFLSDLSSQSSIDEAQDTVSKLAFAADSVYSQGEGASVILLVHIPENTNLSSNLTYIGRPSSSGSAVPSTRINMRVGDTDVAASTRASLVGSFPAATGTQYMRIESKGSYVSIGNHLLDANIQSIFKSMARSEQRNQTITFCKATNGTVNVSLQYAWAFPNVALNATPTSFMLNPPPCANVVVSMTSNAAAGGLYNTELEVSANSSNYSERFYLPITVDVQVG